MKHIDYSKLPLKAMVQAGTWPPRITVCGAELQPGDELVEAALASDCNECRSAIGILVQHDKDCSGKEVGVKPEPKYEEKPPLVDVDGKVIAREDA